MSNKRQGDNWVANLLGESVLPEDDVTFTNGSNFGLDGWQFDQTMNEGVLDSARLPETKGLSGLPDGIVTETEEPLDLAELTEDDIGPDLAEMLSEDEGALPKEAGVIDLSWLDPTQEQDPDRLPHNPNVALPPPSPTEQALEKAWGRSQTDGIHLMPNKDKEIADYEKTLEEEGGPKSGLPGARTAEELQAAVYRAMRRSHFGHDLRRIEAELKQSVGSDFRKVQGVWKRLVAEHGLAGRVFVRASVFPGLKNGQWVQEVKRGCRTARYVITEDPTLAPKLSMEAVQEVPWKKALSFYTGRLRAAGFKVFTGEPKAVLKAAFLSEPVQKLPPSIFQPVEKPEVQATREQPPQAPVETPKTAEEKAVSGKRRQVLLVMARWVKEGRLQRDVAQKLAAAIAEPVLLAKKAAAIVASHDSTTVYAGVGIGAKEAPKPEPQSGEEKQVEVEAAQRKRAMVALARHVKAGSLTKTEAQRIVKLGKTAAEIERITVAAVQVARERRKVALPVVKTAEYVGPTQEAAPQIRRAVTDLPPEERRFLAAAQGSGIPAIEFRRMARWARQQMSEGVVGRDFDELLAARFAKPLLTAGAKILTSLRRQHEGLSGHLYVDAGAYVSSAGITGCDKGALKHRGNALKTVLALDRCESCSLKNAHGFCQAYNKRLVASPPIKDPKVYQTEAIRLANASDAEVTASLFDPAEFKLGNTDLDNITTGSTSNEELGDVLFGGMEVS